MRREKLVLQIDGNPVVPIFRRHLERRMALIMRRIVDENLDAAKHAFSELAALGKSGPYGNTEPFSGANRAQAFGRQ